MRLSGLKRIAIRYAPLLPGSTSVAQLFKDCTTKAALNSNPDCSVSLTLLDTGQPTLDVEFINGDKLSLHTSDKTLTALQSIIDEKQQDIKTLQMLREEGYQFDHLKNEEIPNLEQAKRLAKPIARQLYDGLKPL